MVDKATDPRLKEALETHIGETARHIERVEQVFEMHGVKAKTVTCPAIDGILEEADELAGEVDDKQSWMLPSSPPRRRRSTTR